MKSFIGRHLPSSIKVEVLRNKCATYQQGIKLGALRASEFILWSSHLQIPSVEKSKSSHLPKVQSILATTKKPKSKHHWSLKTKFHLVGIIIKPNSIKFGTQKRSHFWNRENDSKNLITYLHSYMHCIHHFMHNFLAKTRSFQKCNHLHSHMHYTHHFLPK